MPRIKSAKKALRQNLRRRKRNLAYKIKTKEATKKFKKLVAENKPEEARVFLPQVYKALDKMAKSGYIKSGRASRIKSRLTKKLNPKTGA